MDKPIDLKCMISTSPTIQDTSGQNQKIGTYVIERTISKSKLSFVKLARHTVTNVKVAIKIIDKTKLNSKNLRKAQREAEILKSLQHPNIVKLYQVMESEKLLCIVMEYLPNGELYDYIAKNGYVSEQAARYKFLEILSAVEHCHHNNVVHRDLKAENMLLDQRMSIKLADFGFGTFQPKGTDDPLLTTWCGSPPYAAPEIFKGEPYLGTAADIWSIGVVLYVLVCGMLPFNAEDVSCLRRQVLEEHFRVPFQLSTSCADLLTSMLAKNPSKRPTISQIYRSKWLSEINDPSPIPRHLTTPNDPDQTNVQSEHPLLSLDYASTSTTASVRQRQRISLVCPPTPTLAAEMKVGKLDQRVIQIMENSGIDRGRLLESLGRCAYDHLTATYLLLGESLPTNRHSLPQTMAPRHADIEALLQAHNPRTRYLSSAFSAQSRSSCPSGVSAIDYSQPRQIAQRSHQEYNHRGFFSMKDAPWLTAPGTAVVAAAPTAIANKGGNQPSFQTAHFPFSQPPHPGYSFGLALPRVAELTSAHRGCGGSGGLRRTDDSPSPPESPINLSCHNNPPETSTTESDCFEGDWFPYQSESKDSPPASSSLFCVDLTSKPTFQTGGTPNFLPPSFTVNMVPVTTTISPVNNLHPPFYQAHASQFCAHDSREYENPRIVALPTVTPSFATANTHQHRRFSATASARMADAAIPVPIAVTDSHIYGRSGTDRHTSGLGSSIDADSRHSSFSHPATSHSVHCHTFEGGFGEDSGIDTSVQTPPKHLFPTTATVDEAPRRKFGVSGRPFALTERLTALQAIAQRGHSHAPQNCDHGHSMEF